MGPQNKGSGEGKVLAGESQEREPDEPEKPPERSGGGDGRETHDQRIPRWWRRLAAQLLQWEVGRTTGGQDGIVEIIRSRLPDRPALNRSMLSRFITGVLNWDGTEEMPSLPLDVAIVIGEYLEIEPPAHYAPNRDTGRTMLAAELSALESEEVRPPIAARMERLRQVLEQRIEHLGPSGRRRGIRRPRRTDA